MATFDQLSPEQRAIVELVLRQGKTYGELSEMLNLPEGRVRELARDALVELAPVSVRGVEEDWRGQLADYVLGQQSGPEATATKAAAAAADTQEFIGMDPTLMAWVRGRGNGCAPSAP